MTIFQAIILGLLQGSTEFIPVSSSGHLVLVPWLLGWDPSGLTFTVVVHLGTVVGVLAFFWQDWLQMLRASIEWVKTRRVTPHFKLLLLLVLGVIPAAVLGLLFRSFFERLFESPLFATISLLITAVILYAGEKIGKLKRDIDDMTWWDGLFIGLAQALAILPGISRSGATIAAGRLRDMSREGAARFSFLLSTPLIIGVGIVQITDLAANGTTGASIGVLVAGFLAALVSAYFVIRWLLNYLRTRSTLIFAGYCVVASLVCLLVLLVRGG